MRAITFNNLTEEELNYLTNQLKYFREQNERRNKTLHFDMTRFHLYSEDLELCSEIGYGEEYEGDITFYSNVDSEQFSWVPKEMIYDIKSHDTLAPIDMTYGIIKYPELFVIGKDFTKENLVDIRNKLLEMEITSFKCEQEEHQKKINSLEEKINKAKSLIGHKENN